MTTLVLGASGATGRLLVQQLLIANEKVKVIVRSKKHFLSILPTPYRVDSRLAVTEADLLSLTSDDIAAQVKGCRAVVSCLGHNLSIKGLFGHPRRLVTESVCRFCAAICKTSANQTPVKFILMNTTGNQDVVAGEVISKLDSCIMGLIRAILPPHVDNEQAAYYLQNQLNNKSDKIEWVVVRPDSLINRNLVSEYEVYPKIICSALFGEGKTSRINVAHFMSTLINNEECWDKWKSKMPVIYNTERKI